MRNQTVFTRMALTVLAMLLALPIGQTASPVEAKQRPRTVTRTFSNTKAITDPSGSFPEGPEALTSYPSTIRIDGLKGTIRDVNLRLVGLDHPYPDELEVLLIGPRGQTALVMANAGGFDPTADPVTLRLDDEAAVPLPDETTPQSGAYRPTVGSGMVVPFLAPAPDAGTNSALSVFDGSNPNGTWRLFVQDEYGYTDHGDITGGWELEITAKSKERRR